MKTFFSLLLAILFSGSSFAQFDAADYGLCIDGPCDHSYSIELNPSVDSYVLGNTMLFSTIFNMTDSNEPIFTGIYPYPRVGVSIDGETYYNKTLDCGSDPFERTCWQDFTVPSSLHDFSTVDSVYVRFAIAFEISLPDTGFNVTVYTEPLMFPNSSMVTGIDVDEELFAIKMYPNPATSSITIETPGSNESVVEILDLAGKRVAISDHTTSIATIDVSEFVSGIYLVKVTTENSEVFIERLLVQ